MANAVAGRFGTEVIDTAERAHDAPPLEIDSSLARAELGWRPQRSFWEWLDIEMNARALPPKSGETPGG